MLYFSVFFGTFINSYSQCPTVDDPNPSICDASAFSFNDLSTLYATDNGDGIVWYDALVGGSAFTSTELVQEGTYYADSNSGSCASRPSIFVDFIVNESGQVFDGFYCSDDNPTIQTFIDSDIQPFIAGGLSVEIFYDIALTIPANSTDALSSAPTNYYIVLVDGAGCESQVEIGTAAVFNSPADPTPVTPQEFCSDPIPPTVADLDTGTTNNFEWFANVDLSGNPVPPALNLSTNLIDGENYFIRAYEGTCYSNTIEVIVNISDPVDPGTSGNDEFCDDNIPVSDLDLFTYLGGTPDTTGTWSGPTTITANPQGTTNISALEAGIHSYTYTVPANGACPEGMATVTITIYETLTSGIASAANPASFCEASLPASFDLFTLIQGYDPDGQWTEGNTSGGAVVADPINLDLTSYTPATYNFTYTQNLLPNPCPEESTTVQVIVLQDPNAGVAINQIFCENDLATNSPFNLFDALDGSQDNDLGIWTDSGGATVTSPIDITGFTVAGSPYQFTYTIDNGTCSDTEDITITVEPAPESGTANPPAEFCEGAAPASFDLYSLIDGANGTGAWTNNNTSSIVADPSNLDLSTFSADTYNFTFNIDPIDLCDDIDVIVSIIINPLPNTGTPNNPPPFCENDPALSNTAFDLFTLLNGTIDAGGTWSDDSSAPVSGALSGNILDLSQLVVNPYNFTYSITDANDCTNSSTVTIIIEEAPESGEPVSVFPEFCVSDIVSGQTYNLFDLLDGEDQTGTWSDDDNSLALSGNTVMLDNLSEGTYDFTFDVEAIGTCDDVNLTVSIIINDTSAPTALTPQEFCDSATVGDLVATGTTIQWYDEATGGTPLDGTVSLEDGETYFAAQTDATTGCESSVRTEVITTIYISPNAGSPNTTPIVACNNTTIDLFNSLDGTEDAAGIWYEGSDNTGAMLSNPTTYDVTGFISGNYEFTYYVVASAPCIDDSTTITVTVEEPLNTGTSNGDVELCSVDGDFDLFSNLTGEDTGGEWTYDGSVISNTIQPSTAQSGTYTYSLTNSCGDSSVSFQVNIIQAANAGTNGDFAICSSDIDATNNILDLFTVLNGSPDNTGVFTTTDLPSFSGTNVDLSTLTSGTTYNFTYTVTASSPCTINSTAEITVAVNNSADPIVVNATPSFCLSENPIVSNLDVYVTGNSILWYEDLTSTTPLDITTALEDGEDYYATQTDASACESSVRVQINVTINDTPTPTVIPGADEFCISDGPTIADLTETIAEYDSDLNNVVWYDAFDESGVVIDFASLLSHEVTYYAALIDPTTGCESSMRLAVTVDLISSCDALVFPDGFSPNGDGVNDTYDVENLALLHPNFNIEIYNRYGNIVYKGNANSQLFDGTSNQSRLVTKGDLPVGVYFYIINFNDQNKSKQGRFYLSR